MYETVQRYSLRLLDGVRNSSIYLASRLTVHSARDAFDKTRHVLNRVYTTGHVVATERVPRATQAIVDAGHRNQVHFVKFEIFHNISYRIQLCGLVKWPAVQHIWSD
jgi:hypothetical protein